MKMVNFDDVTKENIKNVTTKTTKHPKPPETTRNHPKPSKTTENHPKPSATTHPRISTATEPIRKKLKTTRTDPKQFIST